MRTLRDQQIAGVLWERQLAACEQRACPSKQSSPSIRLSIYVVYRNVGHLRGPTGREPTIVRNVSRRLERLDARALLSTPSTVEIRVLLVHPEEGLTGVLVFETGKPTTKESGHQTKSDGCLPIWRAAERRG